MKKYQKFMIWFLPLIVIGGLFYPHLGYLAFAFMTVILIMAFFTSRRFWCWNLCPRGSFLDIVMSKASRNKPLPKVFLKEWFRWLVFVLLMSFLTYRLYHTGGNLVAIGAVFVAMCLITTIIAIVLGIAAKHRGWCMICPMGLLQDKIAQISQKKKQ